MTDLVQRLYAQHAYDKAHYPPANPLWKEAAQYIEGLQEAATSTCGTSPSASKPNPPPEGKVASQPVAWRWCYEDDDGATTNWYYGPRPPSLILNRAIAEPSSVQPLYASPTEQASDVSGLAEALSDALMWILPMAKGYAHEHPVGRNAETVQAAEEALAQAQQVKP